MSCDIICLWEEDEREADWNFEQCWFGGEEDEKVEFRTVHFHPSFRWARATCGGQVEQLRLDFIVGGYC